MEPRPDRAHRHAQRRGDRLVVALLGLAEHEHGAEMFGQLPEQRRDRVRDFLGFERPRGIAARVGFGALGAGPFLVTAPPPPRTVQVQAPEDDRADEPAFGILAASVPPSRG